MIGIAVMLFAPEGLGGLFSARTGIRFSPTLRRLTGGTTTAKPERETG